MIEEVKDENEANVSTSSSDPVKDDLKTAEDALNQKDSAEPPVASSASKAKDETSEYSDYSDSEEENNDKKKL